MFTYDDLRALLRARPFVPFRLHLSDGEAIDVRHQEYAFPFRRYCVVGLPDADKPEAPFDRHTLVWYMHVTRAELLEAGPPPLPPPGGTTGTPSSSLT